MNPSRSFAIEVHDLEVRYGRHEAVRGLDLAIRLGRCFGLLGRNGAGKTTTIKCLMNLLCPTSGSIRIFGGDPVRDELAVKQCIAFVPDHAAFYPWMTVADTLEYYAAFRERWNHELQESLLDRYDLPREQLANALSRGQKMQLALIAAVCPEPRLLILDEPTAGLDPITRKEFIETVIGAYQSGDPENRTVLVSTHLISEFEGLIDEFAIMDRGKVLTTLEADEARGAYAKFTARFSDVAPTPQIPNAISIGANQRELEVVVNGNADEVLTQLRALNPVQIDREALSLEEIFIATLK